MFRVPVSTYRLQFHRGFRFSDAQALVPYLAALGVTDFYSSPHLMASPGSTHGYDICDHNQLNPEVGTEEDYAAFTAELAAHDMGQIVDFVPNHMGVGANTNAWWRDVLENGRCSPFANYFDIDWDPIKPELKEKVLLPILGDQYGLVLERGEIQLAFESGAFTLRYFDQNLPINPRQFPRILEYDLEALRGELSEENPQLNEFLSITTALRNLPAYTETDPARVQERHREKEVARERLQRLIDASPRMRRHIDEAVLAFNGRVENRASFDRLHELLETQPYRLAYWRTASHEINYRRFFDINELAGLRMDDPEVFKATHGLILRFIREGRVTGLRLDHIDGLFDPKQYLERLQAAIDEHRAGSVAGSDASPHAVTPQSGTFYVVTEKILCAGESLPADWPVAGTSGYDFLNDMQGVFVDRRGQRPLSRVYRRFTGLRKSFEDIVYESKRLIMATPMASELNVLAEALNRLSEGDRRTRDFTLNSLREALREVVACFPIYRTYLSPSGFTEADRSAIDSAINLAQSRNPTMESSIFDFLRRLLLPDAETTSAADDRQQRLSFAMKFQQYTSPVQAKGCEDTAFYRYNLLASLNEVGGSPDRFGCSVAQFHAANEHRRRHWPLTMLASATHDTKRGEDVRARLDVLSELPEDWGRYLSVWAKINATNRTMVHGQPAPDRNDEYLFYQVLLGIWPSGATAPSLPDPAIVPRLRDYMLKATREAKVHTSWIAENQAYEGALNRFVERTLMGPTSARFLNAFLPFQARIAELGMVNSLSQVVLKAASPGIPDFYQGTELWDLSLVDPDNRQPVDYSTRRRLLEEMQPLSNEAAGRADTIRHMLSNWRDGRIKFFVTAVALRLRRRSAPVFLHGTYEPLSAQGEHADRVVAFARRHEKEIVIAVVPRLITALTTPEHTLPVGPESWGETGLLLPPELVGTPFRNVFTGEEVLPEAADGHARFPLATTLSTCPVALLVARGH